MNNQKNRYDVIVVGAGHAGVEAALATSRCGLSTLVITMNLDSIGMMPCNPSIGGPGKGHLVREIDALGGEMAINTDLTSIHVRMLNTSKGPAVRALRAQSDRKLYQNRLKHVVELQENITLRQGMAKNILTHSDSVIGITIETDEQFFADAVIITSGTFMNGLVHIGEKKFSAGRLGEFPSTGLTESLKDLGFELGRLKTGTVPRVNASKINYSRCEEQKPSDVPLMFSHFTEKKFSLPQVSCWITHTTEETHEIIRSNFHRSPMFSGQIEGVGPKYCPSLEDKVNRFPDKNQHPVFIEPEGVTTNEVYLQGISSSLPIDVQKDFLRSIPGLEDVEIMRPAYAIEYDYINPLQLKPTFETKMLKGLYFAGQVNGSSGYEEAGAQGVVAGINVVAAKVGTGPIIIGRDQAYMGVLADDLTTKGAEEPYRLFTSRVEYRLSLRFDNADERLSKMGYEIGLLNQQKYDLLCERLDKIRKGIDELSLFHVKQDSSKVEKNIKGKTLAEALKMPEILYTDLEDIAEGFESMKEPDIFDRIETEVKYEGYLKRQQRQISEFRKYETQKIRDDIDYHSVSGISNEGKKKLTEVRPLSVGQASRIYGVSPSDITNLIYHIRRENKK